MYYKREEIRKTPGMYSSNHCNVQTKKDQNRTLQTVALTNKSQERIFLTSKAKFHGNQPCIFQQVVHFIVGNKPCIF